MCTPHDHMIQTVARGVEEYVKGKEEKEEQRERERGLEKAGKRNGEVALPCVRPVMLTDGWICWYFSWEACCTNW